MELNMELEGETLRLNIKMELTFMTVPRILNFLVSLLVKKYYIFKFSCLKNENIEE